LNGCPVCRAGFRDVAICTRCGADLAPLMSITARAWHLRAAARRALLVFDFKTAHSLSAEAQRLRATPEGRCLLTAAAICEAARNA
jgi:hypothetical protein